MIRLSENVLSSAITLFKWLKEYNFSSLLELSYAQIVSISAEDIFLFANECEWVNNDTEKLILTSRGEKILRLYDQENFSEAKRIMLYDYVLKIAPIWSNRIPYGRTEAVIYMTKDEKACFMNASLLTECPDTAVIDWWDMLANQIRAMHQLQKNCTGRIGERSTIDYERMRTSAIPKWMSVDSNLLGYDIRSQKSETDTTILLIEVKASKEKLQEASFYITRHEWNVAITSEVYVFHLWNFFSGKKLLAIIEPKEILPYIPTNNLKGEWESVKIPFSCFEKKFLEIV